MTHSLTRRGAVAAATMGALLLSRGAGAQATSPAHGITYLEVAPASVEEVVALLRAHATAIRAEAASLRFDVLRRIDRPHHFALIERWRDAASGEVHRSAARTVAFRAAIAPALIAPYDERRHTTLSIGEVGDAPGAITAVTHVDIIPPQREVGTTAVAALAEASRGKPGNLRFDALIQNSRTNHFTLVETWRDEASLLAHAVASQTRAFRDALLPMSGSLFDERLYRHLV